MLRNKLGQILESAQNKIAINPLKMQCLFVIDKTDDDEMVRLLDIFNGPVLQEKLRPGSRPIKQNIFNASIFFSLAPDPQSQLFDELIDQPRKDDRRAGNDINQERPQQPFGAVLRINEQGQTQTKKNPRLEPKEHGKDVLNLERGQ